MAGVPQTSGQMPVLHARPVTLLSYKAFPGQGPHPPLPILYYFHPLPPCACLSFLPWLLNCLGARTVHSTRLLCLPEPEASSQQLASVPSKYRPQSGCELGDCAHSLQVASALDVLICEVEGGVTALQGYCESKVNRRCFLNGDCQSYGGIQGRTLLKSTSGHQQLPIFHQQIPTSALVDFHHLTEGLLPGDQRPLS